MLPKLRPASHYTESIGDRKLDNLIRFQRLYHAPATAEIMSRSDSLLCAGLPFFAVDLDFGKSAKTVIYGRKIGRKSNFFRCQNRPRNSYQPF
jgi:hypothetical protein